MVIIKISRVSPYLLNRVKIIGMWEGKYLFWFRGEKTRWKYFYFFISFSVLAAPSSSCLLMSFFMSFIRIINRESPPRFPLFWYPLNWTGRYKAYLRNRVVLWDNLSNYTSFLGQGIFTSSEKPNSVLLIFYFVLGLKSIFSNRIFGQFYSCMFFFCLV